MTDVVVALEALRSDAAIWDHAADGLNPPKGAIDPLGLTPADVMSYAASHGFDRLYNQTSATMQDMINQAESNFRNLAGALRKAADLYERDEEQNQHHITRAGGH
ncbi:hypothetical protein QRX50_43355 [Amycolatopsis carbonis]|uniref:ESX-1 secretion-associated protein n=1 Tax=Amycolatopsis carbonis TaxID=715471 RepID=A0A9Y2IFH1_9PSEU|nr:hypothetical protein [Amycolatopsis sp. 2-15]WIX78150.1 hypothetical protein QRX50_43355 [Amycolatopsis sp. 2-15]